MKKSLSKVIELKDVTATLEALTSIKPVDEIDRTVWENVDKSDEVVDEIAENDTKTAENDTTTNTSTAKKVAYRPLKPTNIDLNDETNRQLSLKSMEPVEKIEKIWGISGKDADEKSRNISKTSNRQKYHFAKQVIDEYSLFSDSKMQRFSTFANIEIGFTKNFVEMVNNPVRSSVDGMVMSALKKTAFGRMRSIGVEQMAGKTYAEVENLVKKSASGNAKALDVLRQFSSDLMDDIRQNYLLVAFELYKAGKFDIYCYHDYRENDNKQFNKFYTKGTKEEEISKQLKKSVHKVSKHREVCCQMLFWDYELSEKDGKYHSPTMSAMYSSVQKYMRKQSSTHGKYQTMNIVETMTIDGEEVEFNLNRSEDAYRLWQEQAQLDTNYIEEHVFFTDKRQYALKNTFSAENMVMLNCIEEMLTDNQVTVLRHMLRGLSIRDTAEVTGISVKAVRTCINHIRSTFKEYWFVDMTEEHKELSEEEVNEIDRFRQYNTKYGANKIGQKRFFDKTLQVKTDTTTAICQRATKEFMLQFVMK